MIEPEAGVRKFYDRDAEWETFSSSASLKQDEVETGEANSVRAVLGEIGLVLAGALGLAAAIDAFLTMVNVRPFV
jgi:hypothetical protein